MVKTANLFLRSSNLAALLRRRICVGFSVFIGVTTHLIVPVAAADFEWAGGIYDAFDKNDDLTLKFSAGVEYDSNVSVIDIDASTAEDDFVAVFDFDLSYDAELTEGSTFTFGYSFGQDVQFEFSDFDTQIHRGFTGLTQEIGPVETGLSYNLIYARLGGDGFLQMHRVSPHVAGYAFNRNVYWRASYIYTDKTFIDRDERNSRAQAGGGDAFFFLDGLNTYIISGYRYENENAAAPEFDFAGHNVKLKFVQRFSLISRKAKFKAGWRYEDRDYRNVTPSLGVSRDDERHKFELSLEAPINDVLFMEVEYNYDQFNSNLPTADFDQNVATIRLGGKL